MDNTNTSKGMNPMLIVGGVVVLAIIAAGVFFLNSQNNSESPSVDTETTQNPEDAINTDSSSSPSSASGSATQGEVKEFTLEAGSFYYKPNEIRVKKGDKVKVTINSVSMMHDFNIDALNVKIPVTPSGSSGSVEFTADTAGTFEFYCGVGNHRAQGQVGTLIVEE